MWCCHQKWRYYYFSFWLIHRRFVFLVQLSFRYILILRSLFGLLQFCSAFTVSFTSSSTISYSDLLGESIFSFYWLDWLILLTRLLFFAFWKKSFLRFQHLHFGKYFGYGSLIEEFFIVGELLIWETSSNVFRIQFFEKISYRRNFTSLSKCLSYWPFALFSRTVLGRANSYVFCKLNCILSL